MFLSQLKPKTVADRGFRRRDLVGSVGGVNPVGSGNTYYLARYFRKLNENKRNWIAGGRVLSAISVLDSPIKNRTLFHSTLVVVILNSVYDFQDNQFRYCTLCFTHLSF